MQIQIFHLFIRWLPKLILWKTGCERTATATSKVFLASFTITRHFVIKLLMLQNLVLVKSTSNYIHQLACNCILLFLIPKTLLGIFDKLMLPGFGSWNGVDKNATLQKRLNGLNTPVCSNSVYLEHRRWSAVGQNKCSQLKRDSTTTCHVLVSKDFWMQKWAPETVNFCPWKSCTQVITVIFRGDNLPKISEIPFWNFICTMSSSSGKNDFQYLFLQNTSGRNTEWGILCFRVLPEGSRYKQLWKPSMSWVGNIFCCHGKLEPKSEQSARHWSSTSSLST